MRNPIAALAALIAVTVPMAGCAESTAEVNEPAEPPDPAMVRAAEQALADAPAPDSGWRVGVIITEHEWRQEGLFFITEEWAIGVLTSEGMTQLTGRWCDDEPRGQENGKKTLPVLVDPADLITWPSSSDGEVCTSELVVLRKSAAQPDQQQEQEDTDA